ncbi:MAG: hydroxyacid dehydrogenase [Desulfobacterales bacterium]|nr:hydroxyacid dehydrogenase [Deltaproteobacteria bacterium]NNK94595.1 hydroxyacid dehydrogenase [Desulfobacterales bacterium]
MKKIVVAYRFEPGEEALAIMRDVARVVILENDSEELLLREIKDADTLLIGITPRVTRTLIASAPRLKHVARQGVGVDIVDLSAATDRGILVTNVPDVTSNSVAEFAMTLLLSMAKNIIHCDIAVKRGQWGQRRELIRTNVELNNKTHGIVGLGRIGRRVAVRCQAFGMRVLYYKRNRDLDFERSTDVTYVPFETVLQASDSISLHLPLTPETTNLIDTPQFEMMKQGVLLVNHSRGTVVNEKALVQALEDGTIGGYGTDVYEQEPPDPAGKLLSFSNVIASPHLGGGTIEARRRANRIVAEDVASVIRGQLPRNLVNREVLEAEFRIGDEQSSNVSQV